MKQSTVQLPAKKAEQPKPPQVTLEEVVSSLKSLQDDIGQISELTSEEERVVDVFFDSFLKLMQPLAKTISVSPAALPDELMNVIQANVDPKGNLMILYQDGQMEIRNLCEKSHRELMICAIKDVMPRFEQLTSAHRQKIEDRMEFISSVTNELQKVSKAFSPEPDDQPTG